MLLFNHFFILNLKNLQWFELVYLVISDLVQISENLYDKGAESDKLTRFNVPMDKVLKSLQEPDKV